MKIINVVDEFHPEAGYENNVLSKFLVKKGFEYEILTSEFIQGKKYYMDFLGLDNIEVKDKIFMDKTGVKITRLKNKHFISGRAIWNYHKFIKTVNAKKPDVLFFCGNDTFIFIDFVLRNRRKILKNRLGFKIIADSHMLDMASKNKFNKAFYSFYRIIVAPILIKAHITVIRLQDDSFVEKRLGIPLSQAPFISFGTDTLLFHPDDVVKANTREKLGIESDSFVVLYAGKINESKGGLFFADAIFKKINSTRNLVFLVLANATSEYEEKVLEKLRLSENKVILEPAVPYIELEKFYKCADLVLFPKQCSLSFYDVQACAVPVLLEDNNINVERVSHLNGFTFKSCDVDDLRCKITQISEMGNYDKYRDSAYLFIKENYDYLMISNMYCEIFNNLCDGKTNDKVK